MAGFIDDAWDKPIKNGDVVKFTFRNPANGYFFAKVTDASNDKSIVGRLADHGTSDLYTGDPIGYGPIYLGPASRLSVVDNTTFKPGDRVRVAVGDGPYGSHEGVVTGTDKFFDGKPIVDIRTDAGEEYWGFPENVELVPSPENTRPLVGPAPKNEAPVFQAPFEPRDGYVVDATGREVLAVSSLGTDGDQDDDFARYVAEALNARVFGEE